MLGSYADRLKLKITQHEDKLKQLQAKHSATCDMTKIVTRMKYAIKELQVELNAQVRDEDMQRTRVLREALDRAVEENKERKRQDKLKQERAALAARVLMR